MRACSLWLGRVGARRERAPGEVELGLVSVDVCVDRLATRRDRDRQPLVPVLDEIGVVDLQQRDGHVDNDGIGRSIRDGPAQLASLRSEAAIEVGDSPDGSDDVLDRDLAAADGQPRPQAEPSADLLEGEQIRSIAADEGGLHDLSPIPSVAAQFVSHRKNDTTGPGQRD